MTCKMSFDKQARVHPEPPIYLDGGSGAIIKNLCERKMEMVVTITTVVEGKKGRSEQHVILDLPDDPRGYDSNTVTSAAQSVSWHAVEEYEKLNQAQDSTNKTNS